MVQYSCMSINLFNQTAMLETTIPPVTKEVKMLKKMINQEKEKITNHKKKLTQNVCHP